MINIIIIKKENGGFVYEKDHFSLLRRIASV